jgi:SAM-dependent methyltransferase
MPESASDTVGSDRGARRAAGDHGVPDGARDRPGGGQLGDDRSHCGGTGEPRIGDVYGELLRDALAVATGIGPRPLAGGRLPRPVIEIIERDDGLVNGAPAAHYLDGPQDWQPYDHRAVERVRGDVLDIGVGAGRIALALQARGVPVTGLDVSSGALAVCRRRGVRELVHGTVDDHVAHGRRYDTFLLLGNNLGLVEGRERAPGFLAALAALARPGAQVIAQGSNPYGTTDPVQVRYHEWNRRRGRLGGQLRLRLRYRELGTPWFDYLVCTPDEFGELVRGTPWRLVDVDEADAPYYLATLRLAG